MGRPWPGVEAAERQLGREAKLRGRTLEGQRRERQALYDAWREEQVEADEALERVFEGVARRPPTSGRIAR